MLHVHIIDTFPLSKNKSKMIDDWQAGLNEMFFSKMMSVGFFYGLQIRILFSDYRELLLSDNNMSFTIVKRKNIL